MPPIRAVKIEHSESQTVASSMAKTPNPRASRTRQENEVFQLRALQRHPYFDQIVKRTVEGKSAVSTAHWCGSLASKAKGVKNYTFYTWRLYITTLRRRIKALLKDVEIKEPTQELYEALIDQIRRDNNLPIEEKKPDVKPYTRRIWASVQKAIREIDAEKILKFAFLVQAERIDKLIEKEEAGQLDENGYKEVLVLVAIGAALGKHELGQYFMRAGKVWKDSSNPPIQKVATIKPAASEPTGSDTPLFFWEAAANEDHYKSK
jgi:hypothetical protein